MANELWIMPTDLSHRSA